MNWEHGCDSSAEAHAASLSGERACDLRLG